MKYLKLEKTTKGFSNHWRIKILELLDKKPNLSLFNIVDHLEMNLKTASVHVKRLFDAGLIEKKYVGNNQNHNLSQKGKSILTFLRKLDKNL